ncbi:MAG: hypothetical protein DDT26_01688 [Dehalococcoidia bacterium]|nr:hypothetical protein [Chloroflexota bacterium]
MRTAVYFGPVALPGTSKPSMWTIRNNGTAPEFE